MSRTVPENLNFLPKQYEETGKLSINHNYLQQQFSDYNDIFSKLELLVQEGDYTLGKHVDAFEQRICELTGAQYALGVGSGTDALFLSLKALNIGDGDEVITTPFTFFATIGAIATSGAKPVFVDAREDYNIDPSKIANAITEKTKAILPVHWGGYACEMDKIISIAQKNDLAVIEDSCHGIRASIDGKALGTFGDIGCFSMHPLKNLNVWGDGGYLVTDNEALYRKLSLLRNHGLVNRDTAEVWAYNSRLDSIQAIVANHLLNKIDHITDSRIKNAALYDELLIDVPQITVPKRPKHIKQVYHIYVVRAQNRNQLQQFLIEKGIDAKVHYPVPMHLQPASKHYGYTEGDFPVAEKLCETVISFPVHEFITENEIRYVCDQVKSFYAN